MGNSKKIGRIKQLRFSSGKIDFPQVNPKFMKWEKEIQDNFSVCAKYEQMKECIS